MKWSQTHLFTLKESPSDAEIPSHQLLMRAGLIRKTAPGIYTYGALFLRSLRKFENIIRQELESRGAIEVLMPMVQPKELWEETNRWSEMGAGLLKFKNRNDHWFCLGATHEEAVTDFVRQDIRSYRDLPKNIYQIQTKYRDEIRPRFGLMRGREFIMKDAYSFDVDQAGALKNYELMYQAYQAIFNRLGLRYRIVEADAGNIGGSQTHEFQLLAEAGEDSLLVDETSQFAANIEVCPAIDFNPTLASSAPLLPLEKFATPQLRTIKDLSAALNKPEAELVKTLFYKTSENAPAGAPLKALKPIAVCLRGSDEVNPIKLKNLLGLSNPPELLTDAEVKELTTAAPGSCGPVGLEIPIYGDNGLTNFSNFVVGANQDDYHLKNVSFERDFKFTKMADLRLAKEGDKSPVSQSPLKSYRGIEVGHVFYLGKKYSEKMKALFLDHQGKSKPMEMGCYGIGVTRTIQAAIEQSHDADGIIWPKAIAPFEVHIALLDVKDQAVLQLALDLEKQLQAQQIEVFIDDRDERPGIKFKDADLLGFPVRVNIGSKGLAANQLEVVHRATKAVEKVGVENLLKSVIETLKK